MERQPAATGTGTSIRDRMALLQLDQVARCGARGPIPPPPPRPPLPSRASTSTSPPGRRVPPPLPSRKASHSSLAESFVSVASTNSTNSSGSNTTTRSVPPVYTGRDSLPFRFPEKKPEPVRRVNTLPPIGHMVRGDGARKPKPPPLPVRRITADVCPAPPSPVRRVPPLPVRLAENSPALPARPRVPVDGPPPVPRNTRPPPVPISSRPVSTLDVPKARSLLPCLSCYDFSGPDRHAGLPRFHRSRVTSLPSLALALTELFPSALEKARVLFTWFHHNVSYDVNAFFGNAIPAQDPQSTLRSGLAVCAGYAKLFAVLAFHAGLEAVVVTGHGKGYGSNPDAPSEGSNHAWNAVKLAPDYWHLIDPCWGAGHITGPPTPTYTAAFSPENFTSPPSTFGRRHFPENVTHQYREDGRILTWAEYAAPELELPMCCVQFTDLFNFSKETLCPATRRIEGGRRERFAVTLPCQHLPPIAPRDEYVLFLNVGAQFEPKNFHVLAPDGTGRGFACEVEIPREPGVRVTLYYVTQLDGLDGKGLGRDRFLSRVGRCAWRWSQVVEWGGTG